MADGDPAESFRKMLAKGEDNYDQIVMCFEGRVPFENTKHDAVIVKGYDTSEPYGLMFAQRFQGIESGQGFRKLGRVSLVSKSEPLPVDIEARETYKTVEEPYVSGILLKDGEGLNKRDIIIGHENGSVLSNTIYAAVTSSLAKNESDFSGKFKFVFVPGTLQDTEFNQFILKQLFIELYNDPSIALWEKKHNRTLQLSYEFDGSEPIDIKRNSPTTSSASARSSSQGAASAPTINSEEEGIGYLSILFVLFSVIGFVMALVYFMSGKKKKSLQSLIAAIVGVLFSLAMILLR